MAGLGGVKSWTVKCVCDVMALVVTHICNQMLTLGFFSGKLNIARVSVVHKDVIVIYLPIIVPSLFRLFSLWPLKNVINTRLVFFFEKINAVSTQKYGFQKEK